jgi:hypothetical protein
MKIRPAGAELFHEDGQTDMTKLMLAFPNFANTTKNVLKIATPSLCIEFDFKHFFPIISRVCFCWP